MNQDRDQDITFDAIVVGGGVSGLICARELAHVGANVMLLEANQRLGGRLYARRFAGWGPTIELGGAYFRAATGTRLRAEVDRYQLEMVSPPPIEQVRWRIGGRFLSTADVLHRDGVAMERTLFHLLQDVQRFATSFGQDPHALADLDIPATDYLDRLDPPPATRELIEGWAIQFAGAELAAVSAINLLGLLTGRQKSIYGLLPWATDVFAAGTGALIQAVANELSGRIRLGRPVTAIRQRDDRLTVTTGGDERFQARRVVCAVPLNTLSGIEFAPALPPGQAAVAADGHVGRAVKVCVAVEGLAVSILRVGLGGPLQLVQTVHRSDDLHLLTGFGIQRGGPDTASFDSVAAAVRHLVPEATVTAMDLHDWNADPFACGTWATYRPGELARPAALRTPFGRLIFAGADCAVQGGLEGALAMGFAAAAQAR